MACDWRELHQKKREIKSSILSLILVSVHFCLLSLAKIFGDNHNHFFSSDITGDFWIGSTNFGNEPNYYWLGHARPMTYTDWNPGEPNNLAGRENCIEMRRNMGFKWNDGYCYDKKYFVCEKDVVNS